MKNRLPAILMLLLAISCGRKETGYVGDPAIQLTVSGVSHSGATISVQSLFADEVYVLAGFPGATPAADEIISSGEKAQDGSVQLKGLMPGMKYSAYGIGRKGDRLSKVEKADFTTAIEAGDLYPYEKGRNGAPFFADITLCTGGGVPNSNYWFSIPETWDKARFAPHVSYTDSDGEHWLFEAFLAITGVDPEGNNFGINNNGRVSADKDSWAGLAEYWAGENGAFKALDDAIADAAARIGSAPSKRYAVMVMPDPVMFERFTDKNSSTSYWGALDGNLLDFSRTEDQVKALQWYIDLVREKFNALGCKYLELGGFYILSEELVATPGGWNYQYKRWDRILPRIGKYLDARNEGLYWIPYLDADGTDIWKSLGITYAWLQPNRYWDYNNDKPMGESVKKIEQLGMGMELEFEYSMVEGVMKTPGIMGPDGAGNYVFSLKDVPSLRSRFREYMDGFKDGGLYGKERIALYSGSNALWQLASSKEPGDIEMCLELCNFISQNPLRK